MATVKSQRGPVRAAFTNALNKLTVDVNNDIPDKVVVLQNFKKVEGHQKKLIALNKKIEEAMLDDGATEEQFAAEYESVTEYEDKFIDIEVKVNRILKQPEAASTSGHGTGHESQHESKYRLPKLELTRYGGDPREWLGFWSQFKSIHENKGMASEEKFQYLIQSTVENSRARDVIGSFPPTAENYPKVIEAMKNRFGKDEVLIEVYVRDLLSLVLSNVAKKDVSVPSLYDKLETKLRALDTLGVTSDKYAAMLYPLVESSLPEEMLRTWERNRQRAAEDDENRLVSLMEFLRVEVESDVRIKLAQEGFNKEEKKEKFKLKTHKNSETVATASDLYNGDNSNQRSCIFCEKKHPSQDCFKANKMAMDDRVKMVQEKRGCFACLQVGHISKKCKSRHKCSVCQSRHYAILCPELDKGKKSPKETEKPTQAKDTSLANHNLGEVMLQTLVVRIYNNDEERKIRVVLDSGSQRSYISKKAVDVLGFRPIGEKKVIHSLFGGRETSQQHHKMYEISLMDLDRTFNCKIIALDENKICGQVSRIQDGPWLKEVESAGIKLSDIGSDTPDIHMLIGADVGGKLFTGKMYPTEKGPVAMETKLGWILMGRDDSRKSSGDNTLFATSLHIRDVDVQTLWRLDVLGINDPAETQSREDMVKSATDHFKENVKINEEGRYEIALPWIEGHPPVSDTKVLAEKRLRSATQRLVSFDKLEDYQTIFDEWQALGVIEKVPDDEVGNSGFYLPHHPVFKPNSVTTPIRPVFDASAKVKNSPSLNDCLEKGANLIELIPSILTRFRMKKFGVVSDVKKAFLQISVRKEDRDLLRFLWWEKVSGETAGVGLLGSSGCGLHVGREISQKNHKIEEKSLRKTQVYRHCRVVFGVSSSPFLLASTINHHLDGIPEHDQSVAQKLKRALYVDNCITSLDTKEDLKEFIDNSTEMMAKGKFELRGWISNGQKFTEKDKITPVLGILWNLEKDTLSLDIVQEKEEVKTVTKRVILSAAHKVFDPIGLSCPVTLVPKLLLQDLWKSKLGWDDPVDSETSKKFLKWKSELSELGKIEIPRWIFHAEETKVSLHIFSDASVAAYSAVIFLRLDTGSEVKVQLVTAKARVSPTKKVTIPRLELMGCSIAARLASNVKEFMETPDIQSYYWTDSSNALHWIQKSENWAIFVMNRVNEIRKLSSYEEWRHIPGEMNPADLPSRGCSAKKLVAAKWWEGPEWLKLKEEDWPKSEVNCDMEVVLQEKKKLVITQLATEENPWYLRRFSDYRKVVRMVAWMRRWLSRRKLPSKENRNSNVLIQMKDVDNLTQQEEEDSEMSLVKIVQEESFKENDQVLRQLNAFRDEMGIWRVKTKIVMREDTENFRCPILLPTNHPLVELLIQMEHQKRSHCGIQVLMSLLREKYWIIKSRQFIRKIIHRCGRCRRFTAQVQEQMVAPLPLERVRDAVVFEVTGIDLGGPLHLKEKGKSWFVIYTCAVYRAVHLELVTSLSTEAFLQSFRRFIARRGRPSVVYTDNGTNFEGTNNALEKLDWEKIKSTTGIEKIIWKFNPPSAPWWGGWWERLVGLVKGLLRRILGQACLDYEELMTVLCDCEEIINSRPLTYMSEDPQDLSPLTPSMFLNEIKTYGVPDLDNIESHGFNKRYLYRQKLREEIRKRFRLEYLGRLMHSVGKKRNIRDTKVGDIVFVSSDNKKRMDWPLARVVELYPGRDGVVRVVKLKTPVSELTRPIQRICNLEISPGDSDFNGLKKTVTSESARETLKDLETIVKVPEVKVTRFGRVVKVPTKLTF